MALAAMLPGNIPADYHVGILRPTGPAPEGRTTNIAPGLDFAADAGSSQGSTAMYTNNNYIPKPFGPPYDRTCFYLGCPIFVNTNGYSVTGMNPVKHPNQGERAPGVQPDSVFPLHVLNMICRDVARTMPRMMNGRAAIDGPRNPSDPKNRPVADPHRMFREHEAALRGDIQSVARKSINDVHGNLVLANTIAGFVSMYNWLGFVVLQNNGAPPALGGQVNPTLALNVANGGPHPYPIPNWWGNRAVNGAHLYWIVKILRVPDEDVKQVAVVPYATLRPFVPDSARVCSGRAGEETGFTIYVGICRTTRGPVADDVLNTALGLNPAASVEDVNRAIQSLPCIDVHIDRRTQVCM